MPGDRANVPRRLYGALAGAAGYNDGAGYPVALRQKSMGTLEGMGWVVRVKMPGGIRRKVWRVTDAGREAWADEGRCRKLVDGYLARTWKPSRLHCPWACALAECASRIDLLLRDSGHAFPTAALVGRCRRRRAVRRILSAKD
jgi:hypothetical protein